jgi:hypothetical protein
MFLETAESAEDVAYERRKPKVNEGLAGLTNDQEVWAAVRERKNPVDSAEKPVKRAEIETLLGPGDQIGEDTLESTFFARVLPRAEWDQPWMAGIERVLLVERLREVAALVGFTRFESASADAETGELDAGVRRAEISRQPEWVPAVENRGEGIFLQFSREALLAWWARSVQGRQPVVERYAELKRGFDAWKLRTHLQRPEAAEPGVPAAAFVFASSDYGGVALECGYPASSIMERVYAVPQVGYGVLLYTASSDAEGTLGGLVQAGRRIAGFVRSALELGGLCSNDPVCGQHRPANVLEGRMLHGAACHGCVLIAETSCEQGNDFLDRALVVQDSRWFGSRVFSGRNMNPLTLLGASELSARSRLPPPMAGSNPATPGLVGRFVSDGAAVGRAGAGELAASASPWPRRWNCWRRPRSAAAAVEELRRTGAHRAEHGHRTRHRIVVRQLFREARKSVWVCGYNLYNARELFADLARPELTVRMLLDIGEAKGQPEIRGDQGLPRRLPPQALA